MALDALPWAAAGASHRLCAARGAQGRCLGPAAPWRTGSSSTSTSLPQWVCDTAGRCSGTLHAGAGPRLEDDRPQGSTHLSALAAAEGALLLSASTAAWSGRRARSSRTICRARADIPSVKLTRLKEKAKESRELPMQIEQPPAELMQWPAVLEPRKRDPSMAVEQPNFKQDFRRKKAARMLLQTYLRQRDVPRIMRVALNDTEGDGRGWAAVALIKLGKYKEAAQIAAGPDGQTPCGYETLRYVTHSLAKAGALEAAMYLSRLQRKCGRTKYITAGSREIQSIVESLALYLQATAQNVPKLLAAHGALCSIEIEKMLEVKEDILALTPNRRYRMLTEPFNQLIRWYGRARLVPQALRACEIMNELGIPRDDMTIHFLSRGAAPQYLCLKRAKRYTQAPPDWPGKRPEVVFIGRTNSGKSAMINALFSTLMKVAPSCRRRAWTRYLDFYEVNRERAGLPHFMMVDTPGLGHADVKAEVTRQWPDLIYNYLKKRESLKHVFHLVDARNNRLLPADKTLIHLLATAQRRSVRYTIVVTKIDVVKRKQANATAKAIREELGQYVDVDIMFASARTLRGIDHLWSKIWHSVTETPRGRRHRELGMTELQRLRNYGAPNETSVADVLGIPVPEMRESEPQNFDSEEWEDDTPSSETWAEDADFDPVAPGHRGEESEYFADNWDEAYLREEDANIYDVGEDDAEEIGLSDEDFERRWREES